MQFMPYKRDTDYLINVGKQVKQARLIKAREEKCNGYYKG